MNKLDSSNDPQEGVPGWFAPVVSGLVGLALVAGLGLRSAQKSLQEETRVQTPSAWAMDLEPDSRSLEVSQSERSDPAAQAKRQS